MYSEEIRKKVMFKMSKMTLREKIGQLIVVGFDGYDVNDNLLNLIREYKVANVILFSRNIHDIKQLYSLNKIIHKEVIDSTGTIPLISIDQEGGMVTRIMEGITFCPGNMTISSNKNSNNAYDIGKLMGEELRLIGINMNFAPSLDVNNNCLNPVIGVRSYSDDPNKVAIFGEAFINGLQSTGIIATAKHFPGHGDTAVDSHLGLPVVCHTKERLDKIELVPFKKVINNVKAIMTAHILFSSYDDSKLPGTLSKKVITDLLRNELGYKGLIVSDCMEMKAIDDQYTASMGSLMGLMAGLDQALISHTYEKQVKALELIYEAVEKNEFSIESVNEKVERILLLKEENSLIMNEYFYDKDFSNIVQLLNTKEANKKVEKLVDNSLTLVKGLNIDSNKETLVIATEPFATTIAEDDLGSRSISSALKNENVDVSIYKINARISDEEIDKIINYSKKFEQVLVCTYNAYIYKNQAKLIKKLSKVINNLFVLSTRSPYDINEFPYIKNYLCLYEYTPASVKTIAKYIKGELIPMGKLPIDLYGKINIGASIYVGLDEYSVDENKQYLLMLKDKGIDKIFISAHMPEMKKEFKIELENICNFCVENNISVILDVSKPMLSSFSIPNIYALRLDYGFSLDEIISMYYEMKERNIKIELNASIIKKSDLEYFECNGIDLSEFRISHNFYPKLYTGLSSEEVIRRNNIFKDFGMKIMMYIPSSNGKRPPMFEGLPTIEEHRFMPLEAILSSVKWLGIDEVFFGDAYAGEEEIEIVKRFDFNLIQIPIKVDDDITDEEIELLERIQVNRIDQPPYFIRSSIRSNKMIAVRNTIKREKGFITIDNNLFKRYAGEVAIILEELPSDKRVNVVGKVLCNDFLLNCIKPGMSFKFIIKKNG